MIEWPTQGFGKQRRGARREADLALLGQALDLQSDVTGDVNRESKTRGTASAGGCHGRPFQLNPELRKRGAVVLARATNSERGFGVRALNLLTWRAALKWLWSHAPSAPP
jgi:hypothetical protein